MSAVESGSTSHAHSGAKSADRTATGKRVLTGADVGRIRASLASLDQKDRLAALRDARRLGGVELVPDVRALLATTQDIPTKRVATQILAQNDPQSSLATLTDMRQDPDSVVRINAAYGLARAGDEQQQAWLLSGYDASRTVAPRLMPVLGAALEDPGIKAPVVVNRFETIANDQGHDPMLRSKAAAIVRAKLGS